MRLFFGLPIPPGAALDIEAWRQRMLPPLERPVPAPNFHITLTFLGEIESARCDQLVQEADNIPGNPFAVTIDELGFFPKPGILWIGPKQTPDALARLARDTRRAAGRAGVHTEKRDFRPHVTLARRCQLPPPASAVPPDFEMVFTEFVLFESITGRRGVHYEPLERWRL